MKIKIQITSWLSGSVLFEYESEKNTIRETLIKAVASGANLRDANLRDADLTGADLTGANLTGADLTGANLRGADLTGANLTDANLTGANLTDANLTGADLTDANLRDADLTDANLTGANLTPIKQDFFMILLHGIKEVAFLKQAVIDGKIDGSTYEKDDYGKIKECSCLSGSLMVGAIRNNGEQQPVREKCILSVRDSSRPAERFFLGIKPGDTPETNPHAKIVLDWINEFETLIK